ncbi:MAG: hypothetical protein LAO23_19585 [Acidobacteriia bacterium]|nr:hypothetical protein [Terriglobia bacterium]
MKTTKQEQRGWRDVEREFRAKRDQKMKITLPRISCLEKDEVGDEQRVA